jgi:hypothetical protein
MLWEVDRAEDLEGPVAVLDVAANALGGRRGDVALAPPKDAELDHGVEQVVLVAGRADPVADDSTTGASSGRDIVSRISARRSASRPSSRRWSSVGSNVAVSTSIVAITRKLMGPGICGL